METVLQALGAMKKALSIEIAARTGIHRDEVVNQLWDLKRQGRVMQHGRAWQIAVDGVVDDTEPEKTSTEIIAEIPAFTERSADLFIPTAKGIALEIRRTKAKLTRLEKLRITVREIRRSAALIREIPRG